jgi:hypothetical protein
MKKLFIAFNIMFFFLIGDLNATDQDKFIIVEIENVIVTQKLISICNNKWPDDIKKQDECFKSQSEAYGSWWSKYYKPHIKPYEIDGKYFYKDLTGAGKVIFKCINMYEFLLERPDYIKIKECCEDKLFDYYVFEYKRLRRLKRQREELLKDQNKGSLAHQYEDELFKQYSKDLEKVSEIILKMEDDN